MMKVAGYLLAGVIVGFGLAMLGGNLNRAPARATVDATALERRLDELQAALALERAERELLEDRLTEITGTLVELRQQPEIVAEAAGVESPLPGRAPDPASADRDSLAEALPFARRARAFDESTRLQRFIDAGLAPDRAQWIVGREEELRMEALQARYDAVRDGIPLSERPPGVDLDQTLRSELGDADYERYLEALGRPVQVGVGSVLAGSPAEVAGFQPGDRVVRYAGERVYDMNDLNRLTYEGRSGETVAVDVLRDGQEIQLFLPRGPLGITSGGRFRRGP